MAAGASASPPPVEVAGPTSDGVTSAEAEAASRPALPWPKVAGEADALAPADEMDGASIQSSHDKSELPFSKARCIALVATLTGAAFLNTLSQQTVVIILPTIGEALDIPESRLQWIVSSYALAFGCFLLLWGRIADIYGKRFIFIAGSFWVTAVNAANPFLPNEVAFDLFRGLHGLGAAANVPTAIGIIGVTFPPGKAKNYAFSCYSAGAPLGSVFGNILSGFVAEYADWKWVFAVTAIMAGLISLAGFFVIPPPPPSSGPPTPSPNGASTGSVTASAATVDWIGATLVTVGLLALMFALTEGNVVGWSTPWIPALIVVSIVIIVAFVLWQNFLEKRLRQSVAAGVVTGRRERLLGVVPFVYPPPLIKVSLFRNFRFSAAMLQMLLFFASFNDFVIYATYFFQDYQGLSPLQTMLRFIPTGVSGVVVAFIVARLLHRVPTVLIAVTGNVAVSIACLLYAVPIPPRTSYFAWGLPSMILAVIGADTTWPSLTLFTSRSLPPQDQAIGGALINASGQLGRAIGLAISTAIQIAVTADARGVSVQDAGSMRPWDDATLKAIRASSWMNMAFGLAALIVAPLVFRGMEIVGKAEPRSAASPRANGDGEEGVLAEPEAQQPEAARQEKS